MNYITLLRVLALKIRQIPFLKIDNMKNNIAEYCMVM